MMVGTLLLAVAGYIIDARGDLSLHRRNASESSPASVASEVHAGDTIRLKANASARILCPDLTTTWQPASQSSSGVFEGCPAAPETIRSRFGQQALGLRAAEEAPWILTPSNSIISTSTPLIRWEPLAGVTRYRVSILTNTNPRRAIWGPALVEGTSTAYSGKTPLLSGVEYLVRVEADGGADAEGRPFVIAGAEARAKIDAQTRRFEQTISEKAPREIATAIFLLNEDFRADAASLLERVAQNEKSPALKLLQARCFGEVGDIGAERRALEDAASAGQQAHDSYSEAQALLGLARMSKQEEADQFTRRASQLLKKLGMPQPAGDR